MSIHLTAPRWLRPGSLLPRWLGGAAPDIGPGVIVTPDVIDINVNVISPTIITEHTGVYSVSGGRSWSPSLIDFKKKKIKVKVNFITVEQGDDVKRVKPTVKRQDFIMPKYTPSAELHAIEFDEKMKHD